MQRLPVRGTGSWRGCAGEGHPGAPAAGLGFRREARAAGSAWQWGGLRRGAAGLGPYGKGEIPSLPSLGHTAPTPACWGRSHDSEVTSRPSSLLLTGGFRCHLGKGQGRAWSSGQLGPRRLPQLCLEEMEPRHPWSRLQLAPDTLPGHPQPLTPQPSQDSLPSC